LYFACVITVDIKGSKKLKNRAEVQSKILNLLNGLNKEFSSLLIADFMMTLGDEFQGVLKTTNVILNIYKYVKRNLPLEFYFGIGIGYIETPLRKKPSEMDGSAFHHSREALKEAKKRNTELVFKSYSEEIEFVLNSVMKLILYVKSKWTKKQRERISFLESGENIKLSDVAKKFQVSKQAISKMFRTAGWKEVRNAEKIVKDFLKKLE